MHCKRPGRRLHFSSLSKQLLLSDWHLYLQIHEDMIRYFPRVQRSDVSIRQIDSHDHILSAFDRSIAAYATDHFRRSGIDLILNCRVCGYDLNILQSCPPMCTCMSVAVRNCA